MNTVIDFLNTNRDRYINEKAAEAFVPFLNRAVRRAGIAE